MGGSAIPGATEGKGRMETCRNPESTGHGSMEKEQRAQADPWDAVDSSPPGNEEQSGHQQEHQEVQGGGQLLR